MIPKINVNKVGFGPNSHTSHSNTFEQNRGGGNYLYQERLSSNNNVMPNDSFQR
jgi:hypothetical protein